MTLPGDTLAPLVVRSAVRQFLLLVVAVAAAALVVPPAAVGGPRPDPWVEVVVLHTNDVHGGVLPRPAGIAGIDAEGEVGGFAALASFVGRERAAAKERGAVSLLLDAGDVWRGTPEGDLTKGDLVVEAFGRLGYDAVAFGNHELDAGVENAKRLAKAAPFPWISANVVETATGRCPEWLRPWVVLDVGPLKVGVIGLSPRDTLDMLIDGAKTGLTFVSESDAARFAADAIEARVDLLLLLTHIGPERDRKVLDAVPRAPLAVGGHTHTRIVKPIPGGKDSKAWIVQAGTGCVAAGRVRMRVNRETREVVLEEYALVPLIPAKVGTDEGLSAFFGERIGTIPELKALEEPFARLTADLPRTGEQSGESSACGNLVTDAMREAIPGTDIALMNKGGLRVTLRAGTIRLRDLYTLLPFDNTLVEVPLSGAQVLEVLEPSVRGEKITSLEVSGLTGRVRVERADGRSRGRLVDVTVGGSPLDPARTYRVVVNSFLAQGGDGYEALKTPRAKDHGILLRDAVREWFRRRPVATPDATPRLRPE